MIEPVIINKAKLYNVDCMELLKATPDNFYDLAIVDPEYGIGASKQTTKNTFVKQKNGSVTHLKPRTHKHKDWDNKPAGADYFNELIRVSKNQIVWGVNYYDFNFGVGRIVWDKLNDHSDQNDVEIAFNSLNKRQTIVRYLWSGFCQGLHIGQPAARALIQIGNKAENEKLIHPTQKPVKLYEWLLTNYAKQGDKILDTHLGSMSSVVACHNLGFEITGCELDTDYFDAGINRVEQSQKQSTLFEPSISIKQAEQVSLI